MKNTTKLAFSVYALTLALATNAAMAGSYNPSCDGNTFKLSYDQMQVDPKYTSMSSQYKDSDYKPTQCNPSSSNFVWGETVDFMDGDLATFCYREQHNVTNDYTGTDYDGKYVSGWQIDDTDIVVPAGTTNYAATLTNFGSAPAKVGDAFTLTPVWSEHQIVLTLTACDWGRPATTYGETCTDGTTGVFVKADSLYKDINRTLKLTKEGSYTINTPQRTGYSFVGYAPKDSGVSSGCYWGNSTCGEFDPATCGTNFNAEKCLWFDSTGHVTQDNLGKYVASATNPIENLDAVWRAHTFTVNYDIQSGVPAGWKNKTTLTNNPTSHTCTFGEECTVATTVPTSPQLQFAGWKCTSGCNALRYPADKVFNGGDSIANANSTDNGVVTLTAQYTVRTNTVNFYADKSSTTNPVGTLYFVYGGYWFDSVEAANSEANKLTTVPTPLANASKAGYTLRGWVFDHTGYAATVESDAGSFAENILVANDEGTLTQSASFGGLFMPTKASTVSAYGTWARNCVDATTLASNNAGSCQLNIEPDGQVWYKNACITGYHVPNTDPVEYGSNESGKPAAN